MPQLNWVCCMPGSGCLPWMFQALLLPQDSRSSPRNKIPISRHVMTVITPADSLKQGQSARVLASQHSRLHPAGQLDAPPDMVFLKKSSLTFGKASNADIADQTEPWPPFCAMMAADRPAPEQQANPLLPSCCSDPSLPHAGVAGQLRRGLHRQKYR